MRWTSNSQPPASRPGILGRTAALAVVLTFTACADPDRTPLEPAAPGARQQSAVAAASRSEQGEREFVQLAAAAPSSAGFYYERSGTLVIRLRDEREAPAARAKVQSMLLTQGGRPPQVRIAPAQFSYAELARMRDAIFETVMLPMPQVMSLDLDEVRNRVVIGLAPGSFAQSREAVLRALRDQDITPAAVILEPSSGLAAQSGPTPPPTLADEAPEAITGGLKVNLTTSGHDLLGSCTSGFVAQRDGVDGVVTNSHCSGILFELDGAYMKQLTFDKLVAYETVDPLSYVCGFNRCRGADAAFFQSTGSRAMARGLILRTTGSNGGGSSGGSGSTVVSSTQPYWYVTSEDQNNPVSGQLVNKSGYNTGWTYGWVKNTCIDIKLTIDRNKIIRCASDADYVSGDGDSGGPIFAVTDHAASHVQLRGIHIGQLNGLGVFSPLWRIKGDLGGSWSITHPSPPPPTPAPLTANVSGPANSNTMCVNPYAGGATNGTAPYTASWASSGQVTVISEWEVQVTFNTVGEHWVQLTVTDATGAQALRTHTVNVTSGAMCE